VTTVFEHRNNNENVALKKRFLCVCLFFLRKNFSLGSKREEKSYDIFLFSFNIPKKISLSCKVNKRTKRSLRWQEREERKLNETLQAINVIEMGNVIKTDIKAILPQDFLIFVHLALVFSLEHIHKYGNKIRRG
jgi:hypothetical protein